MKFFVVFLVVCFIFGQNLISIEAQAKNASHTVYWGSRIVGDTHLYREVVTEKGKFLRKATADFVWNQTNIPYPKVITQVYATDQYLYGKGGYATLVEGGPGFKHVKIHLKSQRSSGFNFIVDIYGR